jgi:hypothetical protein
MGNFTKHTYDYLSKAYGMIILSRNLDEEKVTKAYNTYKLKDILKQFQRKIDLPDSVEKYTLFSGDEINMMALLKAFNKTSYVCIRDRLKDNKLNETASCREPPAPASSMVFELL